MAACHFCQQEMGLFSSKVRIDGQKICRGCLQPYLQTRRERVLHALLQPRPPGCLFILPKVVTRNPDRPKSHERFIGMAAFTDKGICFIQQGRYANEESGWILAFGLIGALISSAQTERKMENAFDMAVMNTDDPNDLIDLLQNSAQVFIYSLEDMTKVKLSHKWLDIRCGKKRSRFQIKGSKKDFLPLKEIAKAYCDAVARRVNPLTVLGRPTPPRQPVSRP